MPPGEFRAALAGAMIETRYQPIVRLANRAPVALEVLARLNHPAYGMLLPHRFVPQIEDAGLAAALTEAVARRAFADMAGAVLAPYDLDIALNFPLDVLLVPRALALLEVQSRWEGIAPGRVVIELTESRPVEDLPGLRTATSCLRDAGYQVVIDDLEPAVPQLWALLDLPFTGIKLDKDLVQRIAADPVSRDFVTRLVDAAKSRGLTVTAEGVEDMPMWDRLTALGVDLAQGFLVARPMPAIAVTAWLHRWRDQRPSG